MHTQISPSDKNTQIHWHPFYEEAIQVILENCDHALGDIYAREILVSAKNEGDKIAISIVNYGNPIPDSILREIKAKRPVDSLGSGLGIYFTWTLLQYIGGDIDIDNLVGEPGVKSTLYIPNR